MIVYDTTKASHGLNPLKCFRLSESAIDALQLNSANKKTESLLQTQINNNKLDTASFFEDVHLKIHRSHLL